MTGIDDIRLARLEAFLALLRRWQRRINLVGEATLGDPWRRHLLDSAQLVRLLPEGGCEGVDIGSGAGFPGLVIAILSSARMTLVDCDSRKCAFLTEAARITETAVTIACVRMESLPPRVTDVVTARACAPLPRLLPVAARLLRPAGVAIFLKGRSAAAELTAAQKIWMMRATFVPSLSDPLGTIVKVEGLVRSHGG